MKGEEKKLELSWKSVSVSPRFSGQDAEMNVSGRKEKHHTDILLPHYRHLGI
jgi:hypothetical protein